MDGGRRRAEKAGFGAALQDCVGWADRLVLRRVVKDLQGFGGGGPSPGGVRVTGRCAGMRLSVDMTRDGLELSPDALAAFCERWKIVELSVIDSGPTDDADAAIEFLVRFQPEVMRRYADAVAMEQELADLAGRDVEVVDYRSVVDWNDNSIRRTAILESAQTVYAA